MITEYQFMCAEVSNPMNLSLMTFYEQPNINK